MPTFHSPTSQNLQDSEDYSPEFRQEMERLYQLLVYARWLAIALLWGVVGSISLWQMHKDFALLLDYFTWTAVRYTLAFHPLATLGLSLCVGFTVGVLVWQSRNILFGVSRKQTQDLEHQLHRIRQQGASHPLWRWVCKR
jgi:hypothetical protein